MKNIGGYTYENEKKCLIDPKMPIQKRITYDQPKNIICDSLNNNLIVMYTVQQP